MRRRADYHYDLPPALIAQAPADQREASRLLCLAGASVTERTFAELADQLPTRSLVIANDARVRPARLRTVKRGSGGAVELLLLEPTTGERSFRALARASKPIRQGAELETRSGEVIVVSRGRQPDGSIVVTLPSGVGDLCARDGELPLPPYIRRPEGPDEADAERYQTVYARTPGAIAAPTAGLHFSEAVLESLAARGHTFRTLTLHVGTGTFAPVRADLIDDHELHRERFEIPAETAADIALAQAAGRPIVAIGTTVVRALEGAALGDVGDTGLFIKPGFRFQAVTHLVTNFHLPESSLLMLVCAFAGYDETMSAYREAVTRELRFFSYGDAMFVARKEGADATDLRDAD